MPRVSTDENRPIETNEHISNNQVRKKYGKKARQSIGGNRNRRRRIILSVLSERNNQEQEIKACSFE